MHLEGLSEQLKSLLAFRVIARVTNRRGALNLLVSRGKLARDTKNRNNQSLCEKATYANSIEIASMNNTRVLMLHQYFSRF